MALKASKAASAPGDAHVSIDVPTTSASAIPKHSRAAATTAAPARRQLATYPSSASNGSASATFPSAAFSAWCATDTACTAAGSLSMSLPYYTDASPFTSATLNWPNVFSGAGVSSLQLVSGVVELQFANFAAKKDQLICSTANPCVAQLTIPLSLAADPSLSFVCLRLEPNIVGSGYQTYGYPPGSDGTAISGIIVNGALRCNTTKFGKHVIMQYKQVASLPPSPPLLSPPPSPPPPPPLLSATGAVYTSDVSLQVSLVAALSFDALKNNSALLGAVTSSLESSLTSSLGGLVPAMLLLSTLTNTTGTIRKISRYSASPQSAVTIEFRLVVPAGATEGQIAALQRLISTNTTVLFAGSPYTAYLMGPASVSLVDSSPSSSLGSGAVIAVTVAALVAAALLAGGAYAAYRWRAYAAILPKKPEGEYDTYGEALVHPSKTGKRRHKRDRVAPEPQSALSASYAAAAGPASPDGLYQPRHGVQSQTRQTARPSEIQLSGGSAPSPPPWNGANGPGGGGGGGGGVAIAENTRVAAYGSQDGGGGGGDGGFGGGFGAGGGGGGSGGGRGGGVGVKSQADLAYAKTAWS